MDWYYKGGLIVGLIWAAARALGAYGEAARQLDIAFLFGFLLTTGGWAALFLVIDWVARYVGLLPKRPARAAPGEGSKAPPPAGSAPPLPSAADAVDAPAPPARSRIKRRRGR